MPDSKPPQGKAVLESLGGPIGILESLIPGTVYVTLFSFTLNVLLAASVAGAISFGFAIYQIIRRRPLTQVIAGIVGLGISIYLPLRDGLDHTHPADYFVPGLLTNAAYLLVFSISLAFRYPVAGFVLALFSEKAKQWRTDKAIYRRYFWVTVLWIGMFAIRLLIEVPLYFAQQVAALGVTKVVLGTPFYALVVWFSWLIARVTVTETK